MNPCVSRRRPCLYVKANRARVDASSQSLQHILAGNNSGLGIDEVLVEHRFVDDLGAACVEIDLAIKKKKKKTMFVYI
jgi:hypothetical protein